MVVGSKAAEPLRRRGEKAAVDSEVATPDLDRLLRSFPHFWQVKSNGRIGADAGLLSASAFSSVLVSSVTLHQYSVIPK